MFRSFLKKLISTSDNSISDGVLSDALIAQYNSTRSVSDKTLLCHAPFTNMYFNTEGHVALCWKTFHRHETYSENRSIMDIWKGENFEKIRSGIKDCQLDFGCQECKNHILEKNFVNVLSKAYDTNHIHPDYPTIMEFELSNSCNLGCSMCNGNLSSTIRKNREKLPPLKSPYGEKFIHELRQFIPHLKEARFNGGEPFLINQYYQIWDDVIKLNPSLRMVIATNGTVLNTKVKEYMGKANFHFNISIDGMSPETYEGIRKGGSFSRLMDNLDYFIEYCRKNDRTICIMINPLRQNWWEMPEFVSFCNERNIHLWFNTIMKPANQALWSLPANELKHIYDSLKSEKPKTRGIIPSDIERYNLKTYQNLVEQQILTWYKAAVDRPRKEAPVELGLNETVKSQAVVKIKGYFGTSRSHESETLINKLREIELLISSNEERDSFYGMVLDNNPESLLETAKNQSAEQLLQLFKTELKNQ